MEKNIELTVVYDEVLGEYTLNFHIVGDLELVTAIQAGIYNALSGQYLVMKKRDK